MDSQSALGLLVQISHGCFLAVLGDGLRAAEQSGDGDRIPLGLLEGAACL